MFHTYRNILYMYMYKHKSKVNPSVAEITVAIQSM